jgi:predicted DNA-binding protein YlxM (UPF0122 family)
LRKTPRSWFQQVLFNAWQHLLTHEQEHTIEILYVFKIKIFESYSNQLLIEDVEIEDFRICNSRKKSNSWFQQMASNVW